MAEPKKEREPLGFKIFRRAGKVEVTTPEGAAVRGRGIVSALQKETSAFGDQRHALGNLSRPLYHFVGWTERGEGLSGGVLTQGKRNFRVLDVREIVLDGVSLCTRLLLEEKEVDKDADG